MTFLTPPPPPQQTVDDKNAGVNPFWHEWFTRLLQFVNVLSKRIDTIEAAPATAATSGMVPYFIGPTETFIVPINKQALFAVPIDNQGILVVDGLLIQVT